MRPPWLQRNGDPVKKPDPAIPRHAPGIPDRDSRDHPNLTILDSRSRLFRNF
jgi:hypothetical protein